MKRNMDVIVELCLQLEALDAGSHQSRNFHPSIEGATNEEVIEHLHLAQEAGLMVFDFRQSLGGAWTAVGARLTNNGHDFLEAMRTPEKRARIEEWAKRLGRALTIDLVIAYIRTVFTE